METARTIARRARFLGYRSETLGQASERHWDALRVLLHAEHVSDHDLADAVDMMIVAEANEEANEEARRARTGGVV